MMVTLVSVCYRDGYVTEGDLLWVVTFSVKQKLVCQWYMHNSSVQHLAQAALGGILLLLVTFVWIRILYCLSS